MNFSKTWSYEDTRPAQTALHVSKTHIHRRSLTFWLWANRDSNPITLHTVIVVHGKNSVVYKVQYNFLMLSRSTNMLEKHGSIRYFI